MDVDEVYRSIGGFGRWQQRMYVLVVGSWIFAAWQSLNPTFVLENPKWRCTVSGIAGGVCTAGIKRGSNHDYCMLSRNAWEFVNPGKSCDTQLNLSHTSHMLKKLPQWHRLCSFATTLGWPQPSHRPISWVSSLEADILVQWATKKGEDLATNSSRSPSRVPSYAPHCRPISCCT
jgi:hypothetical protein